MARMPAPLQFRLLRSLPITRQAMWSRALVTRRWFRLAPAMARLRFCHKACMVATWIIRTMSGLAAMATALCRSTHKAEQLLMTIGTKGMCDGPATNSTIGGATTYSTCGEASDYNSSQTLLNEPADISVDPEPDPETGKRGDIYIADGYGNHRIVVFDSTGASYASMAPSAPPRGPRVRTAPLGLPAADTRTAWSSATTTWSTPATGPTAESKSSQKDGTFVKSIPVDPSPNATPGNQAAILKGGTRACDLDFWPNIDFLADKSPTSQRLIINVDLGNDNVWILGQGERRDDRSSGRCGISPCPGHSAGEFAFAHTGATTSNGDVYIAETITGRRIQKFVLNDDIRRRQRGKDSGR